MTSIIIGFFGLSGAAFSYKLRYIVGVEMAIWTNQKPTIYRNLYENAAPKKFFFRNKPTVKFKLFPPHSLEFAPVKYLFR